jgi:hypothetical protein
MVLGPDTCTCCITGRETLFISVQPCEADFQVGLSCYRRCPVETCQGDTDHTLQVCSAANTGHSLRSRGACSPLFSALSGGLSSALNMISSPTFLSWSMSVHRSGDQKYSHICSFNFSLSLVRHVSVSRYDEQDAPSASAGPV